MNEQIRSQVKKTSVDFLNFETSFKNLQENLVNGGYVRGDFETLFREFNNYFTTLKHYFHIENS